MRPEPDLRQLSSQRFKPQRLFIAGGRDELSHATESSRQALPIRQPLADLLRILKLRGSRDLLLLFVSAAMLPALLIVPLAHVRIPLGLVLVLFPPGYALVAALFPKMRDADGVTRVGLSCGLSIAIMPSIVLVLDLISISLTPLPMVMSLSAWIIVWTSLALWRRQALAVDEAASFPSIDLSASHGISLFRSFRPRTIAGVSGILIIMLSMIVLLASDSQQASTEFYILGAEGEARDYAREVEVGTSVSATLGIVNRESSAHRYRVRVSASDLATPDEQTLISVSDLIVAEPDEPFRETFTWRMPVSGDDKTVHFLLYQDGESEPHRMLQLSLDVTERQATP